MASFIGSRPRHAKSPWVGTILATAAGPVDAVDRVSSRPDPAVAARPGHLGRDGGTLDRASHVTKDMPPTALAPDRDARRPH